MVATGSAEGSEHGTAAPPGGDGATMPAAAAGIGARLRAHRMIEGLPAAEVEWLARHGRIRRYGVGELISAPQLGPLVELQILLSGRYVFYKEREGAGWRKVIEWVGGRDVTGVLPYSRLTTPPGEGRVEEEGDVALVHSEHFPEMIRTCPVFTTRLVQEMLDRARHFQKDDYHIERLISLGRLAAGLAHELNNPTSAIVRGAGQLPSALREADAAAQAIGALRLDPARQGVLEGLRDRCTAPGVEEVRSPLAQARHVEEVVQWLERRGIVLENVEELAEESFTKEVLEAVASSVEADLLPLAVRWLAAQCTLVQLSTDIEQAAAKAADLVQSVKGFTQVNRAPAPAPLRVAEGLAQSLTMLRAKARARGVRVEMRVDDGLPLTFAVSGELNQVWHNLIDNALDAAPEGGTVRILARSDGQSVVVSVEDDGPGIPEEVQERIFEPFFTTKPVGEGQGLGLEIVRRLLDANNAKLEVSSHAGHTEFRVVLPLHDPAASAPAR